MHVDMMRYGAPMKHDVFTTTSVKRETAKSDAFALRRPLWRYCARYCAILRDIARYCAILGDTRRSFRDPSRSAAGARREAGLLGVRRAGYGRIWRDMAGYGGIWRDMAGYGQIWRDTSRYRKRTAPARLGLP